jgi:hypothetical protein
VGESNNEDCVREVEIERGQRRYREIKRENGRKKSGSMEN